MLWWGLVEVGVGYLTAYLPTLQALLDRPALRSLSNKIRSKASLSSLSSRRTKMQEKSLSDSTQQLESGEQRPRDSNDAPEGRRSVAPSTAV